MRGGRFLWGLFVGLVLGASLAWVFLGADRTLTVPTDGTAAKEARESLVTVAEVIDGDTFRLENGESVRLLGVDAPEKGEALFEEATTFARSVLSGNPVRLLLCDRQERDRYGRLLAFAEAGTVDPGLELLRQGLARTLFIPPCGMDRTLAYRAAERRAFREGLGIWALQRPRTIPHNEAYRYVGSLMTVTGRVVQVHAGPKAVHLNFGEDYRTDFTVVIFRKHLPRLLQEGLAPVPSYAGRRVEVTGVVKSYKGRGPEIIVEAADQIAAVDGVDTGFRGPGENQ